MRIVSQVASNSYSYSPGVPLLASPRIAGLLPAQIPQWDSKGSGKPDSCATRSDDKIEKAVVQFREAMIRVAAGKMAFMDVFDLVSELYAVVHPKGGTFVSPYPPGLRLRSLEEMNREIIDNHADALRYLAHYAKDGWDD